MTCMYTYFGGCSFFGFGDLILFYSSLLLMMQFYIFASCLMLITDYMSLTTFSFHLISNEDKWNHSLSLSLSLSFIPLSFTCEGDDYFLK